MKKGKKDGNLISLWLKFIDSFRFMKRSLSDLVDNLSDIKKQECENVKKDKTSQ